LPGRRRKLVEKGKGSAPMRDIFKFACCAALFFVCILLAIAPAPILDELTKGRAIKSLIGARVLFALCALVAAWVAEK